MNTFIRDEWSPQNYIAGSFIQNTASDRYFDRIEITPTDHVLDIGCGDGRHSRKIANVVSEGRVLGLDNSERMLEYARGLHADCMNLNFAYGDVSNITYYEQFDCIVSFWCLHWSPDIASAFENMCNSLKPGGKLYALFSSELMNPFRYSFMKVKESGQFKSLENFVSPIDLQQLRNLKQKLEHLPFKRLSIEKNSVSIMLPSLDVFRKFILGINFFQGQIPDHEIAAIADAMVESYQQMCQRKYNGQLLYISRPYFVSAVK